MGQRSADKMKKRKQPLLLAVTLMGICALVGCGERNTVTNYQDLPEDITSITFFFYLLFIHISHFLSFSDVQLSPQMSFFNGESLKFTF